MPQASNLLFLLLMLCTVFRSIKAVAPVHRPGGPSFRQVVLSQVAGKSMETKPTESLSLEELSLLDERKTELKDEHREYLAQHPEIKTMLSSFMSSLLFEKPEDIVNFAVRHFSTYKPEYGELEPLVVAGPSGVGKGTLVKKLLDKYPDAFGFSVSHTTRGPRPGEEDGVNYHFTTMDKVQQDIADNLFLEHANVHGNVYGTSKKSVQDVQAQGKICLLEIDMQGVEQVKASGTPAKFLFIAPPSMEELEKRLRGRGTETEEKIALRLKNAREEVAYGEKPGAFDGTVINTTIDEAFRQLVTTLKAWYPKLKLD